MKPRSWWINEVTGAASAAEESIANGYHTHVIEAPDIAAIKAELVDVMMYSDEENTEEQILTVLQRHLGME